MTEAAFTLRRLFRFRGHRVERTANLRSLQEPADGPAQTFGFPESGVLC